MTFENLNLTAPVLQALAQYNYTIPTPIQQQAIPLILSGRDLIGCAQTGTGKTAAFAIPILQLLDGRPARRHKAVRALILTPTRELAIQISDNFAAYGRHLNLKHGAVYGGVGLFHQVKALRDGIDILIATPGRLLDLLQQGHISLSDLEIFVLDEADRMLDMGFVHDVKKVIAALPAQRQTLLFSATMPKTINELAKSLLNRPEHVSAAPVSTAAKTVSQSVYLVDGKDKQKLLYDILKDPEIDRSLVFTRTKHGADKLVKVLAGQGIFAAAIHGNKSQSARQRALAGFKSNQLRVLVATDIAARGIDIEELPHVINYDLPEVPETYVHRIGRTGRGGNTGTAVSFCGTHQKAELISIEKLIGFKIPVSAM